MTQSETLSANRIALALSNAGARTWRNNCGSAWMGQARRYSSVETIVVTPGTVVIPAARHVQFGVGDGGADRIGFVPVPLLTVEHEPVVLPVFLAVEIKSRSGRLRDNQYVFLDGVARANGIALVARDHEKAANLAREAMRGHPVWGKVIEV